MNRDAVLTVALALCCVLAIGTSATSLESAVSTKPSEVVDVDYASLPIDSTDAERLREQVEGAAGGASSGAPADSNAEPAADVKSGSGDAQAKKRVGDPGEEEQQANKPKDSGESAQSQRKQSQQQEQSGGSGSNPPERSLLEKLWALLMDLLALLLRSIPLLVVLAAAAVLFRERDRVLARLRALFGGDPPAEGDGAAALGEPSPSNEVSSAWFEMVAALGLDRDPARTPRECARRAVDAGLDREAVGALTETFEAVRYGDESPSSERTRRAREAIRRLREQGFGGDGA